MIGERIRLIRQTRRMSLRELERRSGISNSYLSQLERGRADEDGLSVGTLKRIACGLDVPPYVLLIVEEQTAQPVNASRADDI